LPVTITTVAATRNTSVNNEVTVSWKVESETNMHNYEVEYSADGRTFSNIGTIAPNSNNGAGSYSFLNDKATAAEHFYRIKANSIGGMVQYSAIVKLSSADVKPGFSIQPNPVVNKTLHINFEKMKGSYRMKLLSKQGASVFTKQINVASLNEVQHILIEGIAAGVYDVVLVDAKGKQTVQTVFVQ
jgi:hypothetical protein